MPTPKDLLTAQHCDYTKDFKESIIRYVVEADDCLNKKDDFINLTFNVITGILNISTDTSHIPNITYPITYYLFIDGEELFTDVTYSVEIAQVVGAHHQFSVVIPISSLEGFASTLMDESIHYIGKKISIYFTTPIKENKLEFVGIIDDISLQKTDASTGKIKISGKSPDVLLSNRYDCRSFSEDSVLSDVISTVCGGYDSKILSSSDSES